MKRKETQVQKCREIESVKMNGRKHKRLRTKTALARRKDCKLERRMRRAEGQTETQD